MSNKVRVTFGLSEYTAASKLCDAIISIAGADQENKDFTRDFKKKLRDDPEDG